MQLSSLPPNAPSGVIVNISTRVDGGSAWGLTSAEHVRARFDGSQHDVEAGRDVYDSLWDGPVAEPADPRDWNASVPAGSRPTLDDAVASLRDAIAGVDFTKVPQVPAEAPEYATLHMRYDQRPVGVDHLHPYQERDGRWMLPVRTSLNDLFVQPQLAPVVDAARAVLAAAH